MTKQKIVNYGGIKVKRGDRVVFYGYPGTEDKATVLKVTKYRMTVRFDDKGDSGVQVVSYSARDLKNDTDWELIKK